MVFCLTGHHTGAHRISHAPLCGCIGIGFTHFGMISKAEVVIKTPGDILTPVELHSRTYFSLQFGEHKITLRFAAILLQRPFHAFQTIKNI